MAVGGCTRAEIYFLNSQLRFFTTFPCNLAGGKTYKITAVDRFFEIISATMVICPVISSQLWILITEPYMYNFCVMWNGG